MEEISEIRDLRYVGLNVKSVKSHFSHVHLWHQNLAQQNSLYGYLTSPKPAAVLCQFLDLNPLPSNLFVTGLPATD